MAEPLVIVETGRFVVAEDGPKVLVIDRGHVPSEVTVLLLTICSLVFGAYGVVSMFYAVAGGLAPRSVVVGGGFLVIGVTAFVLMNRAAAAIDRVRRTPLSAIRPVAVFDRRHGVYVDGAGELVAPLDQVRFERRMQMASSAAKLVAVTPDGSRDLLRGSPFHGGVGGLDAVLTSVVHASEDGAPDPRPFHHS